MHRQRTARAGGRLASAALVIAALAASASAPAGDPCYLVPADGEPGDWFGHSVAVYGDMLVAGAPLTDHSGRQDAGAVYVFKWDDAAEAWLEHDTLYAEAPATDAQFGFSVAIDQNFLLVGARGENTYRGAAYLYERIGDAWTYQVRRVASDGTVYDQFGRAVDLDVDGGWVIVGAPRANNAAGDLAGAAYIFPPAENNRLGSGAAADDFFGHAVAVGTNPTYTTAVVGAPGYDWMDIPDTGAVHFFVKMESGWDLLTSDYGFESAGAEVGFSAAIFRWFVLVGAPERETGKGKALLYATAPGEWVRLDSVEGGAVGDEFGCSVALDYTHAVVGARGAGAAYVYRIDNGELIDRRKLQGPADEDCGFAVALRGEETGEALIGARLKSDETGAVYTEPLSCVPVCAFDGFVNEGIEFGHFEDACGSDDTHWAAQGETFAFQISDPVAEFLLEAEAPAGPLTTISIEIEASKDNNNGNLAIQADLLNWMTGEIVTLPGVLVLTTDDQTKSFPLPEGHVLDDFLNSGFVELRIRTIQMSGLPNVRTQLDQVLFYFN